MGVRIEHKQSRINESQYGPFARSANLPAADYKLNVKLPDGYRVEPPMLCDVMAGYPKEKGIEIALRTLGPQCILCDEIGSAAEAEAIRSGVNAGVRFIATIHAASARELMLRPQYQRLKECGAFSCLLFLQGPEAPGILKEVIHADAM